MIQQSVIPVHRLTPDRPGSAGRGGTAPGAYRPRTAPGGSISLSQVLSALSHALDLTEGQPMGHSIRSSVIAMRIASEIQLPHDERSALYYAMLLKDAGCSSNAARMSALYGSDDRLVKARMKMVNWHGRLRLAVETFRNAAVGGAAGERISHFLGIARTDNLSRDIIRVRCERGADIALRLGFPELTSRAVQSLDEHWNGKGYPEGLRGEAIPLLSRIANIAQTVEVFHGAQGVGGVMRMLQARRGRWFDPALAKVVLAWGRDFAWWASLAATETPTSLDAARYERWVEEDALDDVARAFADIIDAKSPFTFAHSSNVARFADGIATELELEPRARVRLLRASLLHDVGKLGVSSRILDKAGPLTPAERAEIERHPAYTWQILSRIEAFRDFAWTASVHHEKLDGSGYPWQLTGAAIEPEARILVVADIYEALTADRPYRAGLSREAALGILEGHRGTQLCAEAIEGLRMHTSRA
jgi:HD-GYP domain-containing protein (c-di-GMP phosphodiesterase class II)